MFWANTFLNNFHQRKLLIVANSLFKKKKLNININSFGKGFFRMSIHWLRLMMRWRWGWGWFKSITNDEFLEGLLHRRYNERTLRTILWVEHKNSPESIFNEEKENFFPQIDWRNRPVAIIQGSLSWSGASSAFERGNRTYHYITSILV